MPRKIQENNQLPYMKSKKRENPSREIEYMQPDTKKMRQIRMEKIREKKRKREEQNTELSLKQHCLATEQKHSYLSLYHGMMYFTPEHIKHLKESYSERSYLGIPEYSCTYCNAIF
jgi:hypothetical protein